MQHIERLDKQYLWHPFTQMQDWVAESQMVIEQAEGVKLIDSNGKAYYDGVSSLWVNIHGHRKAEIDRAIIDQLGKVAHTTMLGLINVPASQLAEKLVKLMPQGLSKVFFSDDGSTAVEIAIKMAYQYWQLKGQTKKRKFLTLKNAYHGDTVGTVSVGGIDLFHRIFSSLLFDSFHAPCPCCYHCQLTDEPKTCGMACVAEVEKLLAAHHEEMAGMIIEPLVQAAAGMLTQPPGYLKAIRELTKKYNVLLLVDEVATGFGRTGTMFACEQEGISPDMMMLSKGITGGYLPLAATVVTEEIYQAFLGNYKEQKTFFHGHSYTGNPLACAAALANLEVFEREQTIAKLAGKIQRVKEVMAVLWQRPHVGDIRQQGMIVGIELVEDKGTKKPYAWNLAVGAKVCKKAREYGMIIRPLGNIVVFMPPLASTMEELEDMLKILTDSICEITENRLLAENADATEAVLI